MLDFMITAEAAARAKQPIDAEQLIQWAIARSGRLPWANAADRELAFDRGITAKPSRPPHVTWSEAEVCAGLRLANGRALYGKMMPGPDGARVLTAIAMLEPATAAMVIACGRSKIRPDWMPGIEPRRVPRVRLARKRRRKVITMVWEPCDPGVIRAARNAYRRWHCAVDQIRWDLQPTLESWEICGFAAPAAPWLEQS